MSNPIRERNTKTANDIQPKPGQIAAKIMQDSSLALTDSGNACFAAFQDLTKAYQELAARNSTKLTESFQQLKSVKTPNEFLQLQQKLVKEAFDAALTDSHHIADLTVTVFNSAFTPLQKQLEAAHNSANH